MFWVWIKGSSSSSAEDKFHIRQDVTISGTLTFNLSYLGRLGVVSLLIETEELF